MKQFLIYIILSVLSVVSCHSQNKEAMKAKATILADLKKIERMDLLILDDFGMQPFDAIARINLLDVIEDRYGEKSTIITSQIPVNE